MLNNETIKKIDLLTDKIRENTATLKDYEDYEKLLIDGGFQKEFIIEKLKEANIENYKELIEKRKEIDNDIKLRKPNALDARKIIEGIAVVGLVAFGLALLFEALRGEE